MSPIDLILHLDDHLAELVQATNGWSYVVLGLIVFCETGLIVTPFLPGDSLLFAAGSLAGIGVFSLPILLAVLFTAAVLGDTVNYWIGRRFGRSALEGKLAKWINPKHIVKTQEFYHKHGAKMIFLARFVPIVRTFAPFVAGIGHMAYPTFIAYNLLGASIWVGGFTLVGYLFGNIPWVKENFGLIVIAIILISLIPFAIEIIKSKREAKEDDKALKS